MKVEAKPAFKEGCDASSKEQLTAKQSPAKR